MQKVLGSKPASPAKNCQSLFNNQTSFQALQFIDDTAYVTGLLLKKKKLKHIEVSYSNQTLEDMNGWFSSPNMVAFCSYPSALRPPVGSVLYWFCYLLSSGSIFSSSPMTDSPSLLPSLCLSLPGSVCLCHRSHQFPDPFLSSSCALSPPPSLRLSGCLK